LPIVVFVCYVVQFIKTFVQRRKFQLAVSALDAQFGYSGFAFALGIPHQRLFQTGLKVIGNHPKVPGFGLFDVAFPLGAGRVGIVDYESLLGAQTGVDKLGFLIARVELIQGDVDVGAKEVVEVKGSFSGSLDADEEDGLHEVFLGGKQGWGMKDSGGSQAKNGAKYILRVFSTFCSARPNPSISAQSTTLVQVMKTMHQRCVLGVYGEDFN